MMIHEEVMFVVFKRRGALRLTRRYAKSLRPWRSWRFIKADSTT
ncbi:MULTISPECIES: hypothetical protein [unclassified Nostoc]|nr:MULTISPECIES: hypothetical protein [unclassified Nostoc]